MSQLLPAFWSMSVAEALRQLEAAKEGLTGVEARERLVEHRVRAVRGR